MSSSRFSEDRGPPISDGNASYGSSRDASISSKTSQSLPDLWLATRKRELYPDITLISTPPSSHSSSSHPPLSTVRFPAHRAPLAAVSSVFNTLFSQMNSSSSSSSSSGQELKLGVSVPTPAVHVFLDYVYAKKPKISRDTHPGDVLKLAHYYEVKPLLSFLDKHVQELIKPETAVEWYVLIRQHDSLRDGSRVMPATREKTMKLITSAFPIAILSDDFVRLGSTTLRKLLRSDELKIPCECHALSALLKWMHRDRSRRLKPAVAMMKALRWEYMAPRLLQALLTNELFLTPHDSYWPDLVSNVTNALCWQATAKSTSVPHPRDSYSSNMDSCQDCPRQQLDHTAFCEDLPASLTTQSLAARGPPPPPPRAPVQEPQQVVSAPAQTRARSRSIKRSATRHRTPVAQQPVFAPVVPREPTPKPRDPTPVFAPPAVQPSPVRRTSAVRRSRSRTPVIPPIAITQRSPVRASPHHQPGTRHAASSDWTPTASVNSLVDHHADSDGSSGPAPGNYNPPAAAPHIPEPGPVDPNPVFTRHPSPTPTQPTYAAGSVSQRPPSSMASAATEATTSPAGSTFLTTSPTAAASEPQPSGSWNELGAMRDVTSVLNPSDKPKPSDDEHPAAPPAPDRPPSEPAAPMLPPAPPSASADDGPPAPPPALAMESLKEVEARERAERKEREARETGEANEKAEKERKEREAKVEKERKEREAKEAKEKKEREAREAKEKAEKEKERERERQEKEREAKEKQARLVKKVTAAASKPVEPALPSSAPTAGAQSGSRMSMASGASAFTPGIINNGNTEEAEARGYVEWINHELKQDKHLGKQLPLKPVLPVLLAASADGTLLCKLLNTSVHGTVDERVINFGASDEHAILENWTLFLNSAKAVGCNLALISAQELASGDEDSLLEALWQVLKAGLHVRISRHPKLPTLAEDDDDCPITAVGPDKLLLRWVNKQLKSSGSSATVKNFEGDLKNSEAYIDLLAAISPKSTNKDALKKINDPTARAAAVLKAAHSLTVLKFASPASIVDGNDRLNFAFLAYLMLSNFK